MNGGIEIHVGLTGHNRLDFDKRIMRKRLRAEAGQIRKEARKLISRRAISQAGEYPGLNTGDTRRSIYVRVTRSGLAAIIEPKRTSRMDKREFYPSILTYGVPGRIDARKNYIEQAASRRRAAAMAGIGAALLESLKPR